MNKLINNTIVLVLCFVGAVGFSQQKKWTLLECVNYALENNISIQQSELDVQQNELNKKDAIGNFLPTMNANGNHSWNIGLNQNITTGLLENLTTQFTSFGLSSNVDIYNGLRNINQLHRSNLAILASQYQLADMKDDISLFVANAFLQILFNKEQLKIQQAQYEITNKDLIRTQELVDEGVLPRGDALELKATLASQVQQIVNTENALLLSKISLAQTLRIDDYENFDTMDVEYEVPLTNILDESPEAIIEKAKENRYDLKIADANVKLAEYDLKLAKGNLQPSVTGFYRYNTRASYSDRVLGVEATPDGTNSPIGFVEGTGETVLAPNFNTTRIIGGPDALFNQFSLNDGHNFGISLNIPILNGFSAKNNVQRNSINLKRSKNQYEQAKLDLETEVYQAMNDAKGALKTYEAAIKTEEARKEAFSYAKERYNIGLANSFEFSQSQARYEQALSEVIRAKYDYIFKLKVLEFYFGIPITDLSQN
ncbi:TolC family protein [Jejuia pallidilutea]|uniref:RND efflux system n=1 Tax=Jejuia pallidilutea TaxID=504487 RepID=A0A090VPS6_9FLAO|nr:TolC family protein [Jejuia pallidilutea]GAL65978.1 RND efflux system outer membrane lipoprotein CmeC [Jejuia pallidilutea]GAL70627.1 RND efflux system [Jejuia pallidilutea]GAL88040.1 RND efflux system outer membrane lipoprotein CmeC [Jejuia pallidilutea]